MATGSCRRIGNVKISPILWHLGVAVGLGSGRTVGLKFGRTVGLEVNCLTCGNPMATGSCRRTGVWPYRRIEVNCLGRKNMRESYGNWELP